MRSIWVRPTSIARNTIRVFDRIRKQTTKKINGWRVQLFSIGSKEIPLKPVVQAVPTYSLSLFKIPNGIVRDLNRFMANFWWGGSEDGKKTQ